MDWNQALQGQHAAFQWFTESHLQSVIRNGSIPTWFHGIISRKTAEVLLMSKPPGYFLIRVSESRIGYSLSHRADNCCRHYMIDVSDDGQWVIVGEDKRHRSLQDLVEFHQRAPFEPFNEVLTVACGQTSSEGCDYADLLFPQRQSHHQARLQPVDGLGLSLQNPQDEVFPVPSYLLGGLNTCSVVTSGSQPLRLYPGLSEYPQTSTSDVPPVPKPRKKYLDEMPYSQPPHVPTSVSTVESPSSPTTLEPTTGAINTGPLKNQEVKPSFVRKILRMKFQKKTRSLQEFFIPDGSSTVDKAPWGITDEQNFDHQQFSCKDSTSRGMPQEYRLPPPFAPGYS